MKKPLRLLVIAALVPATIGVVATSAEAHPQLHKGCAQTATRPPLLGHFYVGAGHMSCRTARRNARRAIRHGITPRRWYCEDYFATYGTCRRGNRIVHWWGGGE
jgi:hypothetical protein